MFVSRLLPALGAIVLLSAPVQAQAPDGGNGGSGRGQLAACRADAASFCRGIEAGRGRRMACLAENRDKLSPQCAEAIELRGAGRAERRGQSAAASPGSSPPAGLGAGPAAETGPDRGPVPQARAAPRAEPLPGAAGGGQRGGRLAACRTDAATHCQSVERGGGEKGGGGKLRCLKANQASLSPECQSALGAQVAKARNFRAACKADRETHCAGVARGGGRLMQCLRTNQDKLSPACGTVISAMPERGRAGRRAEAGGPSPLR